MKSSSIELSIKEAIVIIILYNFFVRSLINCSFNVIDLSRFNLFFQTIIFLAEDIITYFVVIWLILKKIRTKHKLDFKLDYLGSFNFKLLGIIILIFTGYFLWYHSSVGILVNKIPHGEIFNKFLDSIEKNFKNNPYHLLILGCLIGPIYEEIVFRGIILKGLLNRYKPANAILISALIFGISHLNMIQFVNATLIGLLLGIAYYKSHSILLCISLHIYNNSLPFILERLKLISGTGSFIIGIALFIAGSVCFVSYLKKARFI